MFEPEFGQIESQGSESALLLFRFSFTFVIRTAKGNKNSLYM